MVAERRLHGPSHLAGLKPEGDLFEGLDHLAPAEEAEITPSGGRWSLGVGLRQVGEVLPALGVPEQRLGPGLDLGLLFVGCVGRELQQDVASVDPLRLPVLVDVKLVVLLQAFTVEHDLLLVRLGPNDEVRHLPSLGNGELLFVLAVERLDGLRGHGNVLGEVFGLEQQEGRRDLLVLDLVGGSDLRLGGMDSVFKGLLDLL